MRDDEDPIVGAGGANKPEKRNEGDTDDAVLPRPEDGQTAAGDDRARNGDGANGDD